MKTPHNKQKIQGQEKHDMDHQHDEFYDRMAKTVNPPVKESLTTEPKLSREEEERFKRFREHVHMSFYDWDHGDHSSADIIDASIDESLEIFKEYLAQETERVREERERIIEIIKNLYVGNDAQVNQRELIDIINGEFVESWRKDLKQLTKPERTDE